MTICFVTVMQILTRNQKEVGLTQGTYPSFPNYSFWERVVHKQTLLTAAASRKLISHPLGTASAGWGSGIAQLALGEQRHCSLDFWTLVANTSEGCHWRTGPQVVKSKYNTWHWTPGQRHCPQKCQTWRLWVHLWTRDIWATCKKYKIQGSP